MSQMISQVPIFTILGILLFSLSVFPTHASADDKIIGNEKTLTNEKMVETNDIKSPTMQLKDGVMSYNVKCRSGFTLVLKSTDNLPACVKPSSVYALVTRGWAISENVMMKMMNQNMTHKLKNMKNDTSMKNETMSKDKMLNDSPAMSQSSVAESHYTDAPTLVGISDYINTTPSKLAQDMKGKVIVYDFWTFNCINCIHTLPHVVDLSNKYLGKGVLVIGIHSPETFIEKDPNNVREAVHRYNISYPVVTDNEFHTWNAFGNHYWPHIYIADAQGKIRYNHIGEGAYDEIDNMVASLLLEQENQKQKELAMG